MSKRNRIRSDEWLRRQRQAHAARFQNWRQRTGQQDQQASLIQYRLIGRKRYRADKSRESRRLWA